MSHPSEERTDTDSAEPKGHRRYRHMCDLYDRCVLDQTCPFYTGCLRVENDDTSR